MAKRQEEGTTVNGIMLRNGRWYARITVRGKQKWRSAPNRKAAEVLLGRMREDAERERIGFGKVQRTTLKQFAPRYLAWAKLHKRSWKRDEMYLEPMVDALGHFRLAELTRARVESYMAQRRETESISSVRAREAFERAGKARRTPRSAEPAEPPAPRPLAPATVNREGALIRRLLNLAVELGELETNLAKGIRLYREAPGRVPALDGSDEAALFAALPDWMRPIVRIALLSGMREGEILALRWRNVDFESGVLIVEDSKSGEARRVPLHPALADELLPRRGAPDDYVAIMPSRRRRDKTTDKELPPSRDPHTVSQAFRRAARSIGRPDLCFHSARHVHATRLLAVGASLPEVAATLGHKTLAVARRYAHVSPARLAALVAAVPRPVEVAASPEAGDRPRLALVRGDDKEEQAG